MAAEETEVGGREVVNNALQRIGVKEAVRRAGSYMQSLYEGVDLPNLRLEEVELSDDERHWLVTFGFTAAERDVESNPFVLGNSATRPRRDYKIIKINAQTGEPESMKIRDL